MLLRILNSGTPVRAPVWWWSQLGSLPCPNTQTAVASGAWLSPPQQSSTAAADSFTTERASDTWKSDDSKLKGNVTQAPDDLLWLSLRSQIKCLSLFCWSSHAAPICFHYGQSRISEKLHHSDLKMARLWKWGLDFNDVAKYWEKSQEVHYFQRVGVIGSSCHYFWRQQNYASRKDIPEVGWLDDKIR